MTEFLQRSRIRRELDDIFGQMRQYVTEAFAPDFAYGCERVNPNAILKDVVNCGELQAGDGAFLSTVKVHEGGSLIVDEGACVYDIEVRKGSHVHILPGSFVRMANFMDDGHVELGGKFADIRIMVAGSLKLRDSMMLNAEIIARSGISASVSIVARGLLMASSQLNVVDMATFSIGDSATLVNWRIARDGEPRKYFVRGPARSCLGETLGQRGMLDFINLRNANVTVGDNLFLTGSLDITNDDLHDTRIGTDVRISAQQDTKIQFKNTTVEIGDRSTVVIPEHYGSYLAWSVRNSRNSSHEISIPPDTVAVNLTSAAERNAIIETKAPDSGVMVF